MATTTTTKPAQAAVLEMPKEAPVDNLPAPRARSGAVQAIVPSSWSEIVAIASAICRAKMAPKSYCDRDGNPFPDKVAVSIMHGMEVGMTPMAALQSIAVINGMPSLYGDGMLAVVRASGLLEDFVEELEWDGKGPLKAVCRVKRRGEPTWGVMDCARDDCIKAGWWSKDGPWKATPHRMMQMRARGWALRDKFADVLRGLRSAEEVEDMVDVTPGGSSSVAPAEPSRSDFDPKFDTVKTEATAAATTDPKPAEDKTVAPAKDPKAKPDKKPKAEKVGGRKAKGAKPTAAVTDVEDQNAKADLQTQDTPGAATEPSEPMTFDTFTTARAFFDFSDAWLQDPKRTPAEAKAWEAFYHDKLAELAKHEFDRVREAVGETISYYSAVLAKEQPE